MLSRDEHDDIVARISAAAVGAASWSDTLEHVASAFGSRASLCQVTDPAFTIQMQKNHGYSQEFADSFYASEVYANDPRIPYYRSVRRGELYYDHALYDVAEMDKNPWCQESYRALGVKYQLGTIVSMPNQNLGTFTVLSTEKEGHASEETVRAFRRLVPHIEQALSIGHVLGHHAATQVALLDALAAKADGILILGRSGVPTFVNDAAQQILGSNDGLAFVGGELVTRRGPETRRLRAVIHDANTAWQGGSNAPGGTMLVTRPSGKRPFVVRVMPAPAVDRFMIGGAATCVIHLHDLAAQHALSKETLCEVFGLSEREAALAVELVRCTNLASAAANAGMAFNTARNHLRSIFRKTDISTQAEAVQLFSHLR